jgi:hypothetical protein
MDTQHTAKVAGLLTLRFRLRTLDGLAIPRGAVWSPARS